MADRLTSIRKQIAALEKRADELRKKQNGKVIAQIKALIDKHELTAADLGFGQSPREEGSGVAKRAGRAAGAKRQAGSGVGVAKYRDPKSGKTWTGRGKPPAWIASARDRTRFLIDGADVSTAPAKQSRKAAKKVTKAAPKKRAPRSPTKKGPSAKRGARRPNAAAEATPTA